MSRFLLIALLVVGACATQPKVAPIAVPGTDVSVQEIAAKAWDKCKYLATTETLIDGASVVLRAGDTTRSVIAKVEAVAEALCAGPPK